MNMQAYTRASARAGEPAVFLAIATIVIALGLVGLRMPSSVPVSETGEISVPTVSMRAFELPPPTPAPKPTLRATRTLGPVPIAVPATALSRADALRVVLATAHSLLGRPYSYGAAGPNAFDCSGFTSFVWRASGLTLPHASSAQYSSLPRVPVSDLQSGDLVFSGRGRIGHAGLYIGDGRMINAVETGRGVEVEPLRDNLIGATRPALLLKP